jgi:hypothetical protein
MSLDERQVEKSNVIEYAKRIIQANRYEKGTD